MLLLQCVARRGRRRRRSRPALRRRRRPAAGRPSGGAARRRTAPRPRRLIPARTAATSARTSSSGGSAVLKRVLRLGSSSSTRYSYRSPTNTSRVHSTARPSGVKVRRPDQQHGRARLAAEQRGARRRRRRRARSSPRRGRARGRSARAGAPRTSTRPSAGRGRRARRARGGRRAGATSRRARPCCRRPGTAGAGSGSAAPSARPSSAATSAGAASTAEESTRCEGLNPWLAASSANEVRSGTCRIFGTATNVPSPCTFRITPLSSRSPSAWRTVARETPYRSRIAASVGKRSPGSNPPSRISRRSASLSCAYSGSGASRSSQGWAAAALMRWSPQLSGYPDDRTFIGSIGTTPAGVKGQIQAALLILRPRPVDPCGNSCLARSVSRCSVVAVNPPRRWGEHAAGCTRWRLGRSWPV